MKVMKRILSALLVLTMLILPLSACGDTEGDALQLRITASEQVNTLDPALVDNDTEKTVAVHLFENLMKMTEKGATFAQAKNCECVDNLDGTETYTFTLRDGIKWSDGRAVIADDFVYAWQRLVSPDVDSPNRQLLDMVAGYDAAAAGDLDALQIWAEDALTLVVVLNCHCPYFLSSICTAAATMPVRSDVIMEENWSMHPQTLLTNGAYQVSQWENNALTLDLSDNYYDSKRVSAKSLKFSFDVPQSTAMTQYANEEVDIVMDAEQTEESLLSYRPEVSVLLINQMAGTLSKEMLRQAMSLVLDRNELCKALGKQYIPADGLVPYGTRLTEGGEFRDMGGAVIDNTPEDYEACCTAALDKLDTINYSRLVLESLGTVTLLYENIPAQTAVAVAVQKMWKDKLGLQITLKPANSEDMQAALESGEFSIALLNMESDRNDAWGYLSCFSSISPKNYGMYYSNAFDMLLRATESASSDGAMARDAYLEDAEKLLLESGYVIPLYNNTHSWLVRPGLTGALDNGQDAHYFAYTKEIEQ